MTGSIRIVAAIALTAAATDIAAANPPPAEPSDPTPADATDSLAEETPWSRGTTPEQRAEAQRLLDEGNELFLASRHREALARYEQAVSVWDHPAIRFNIVRVLIQLDKPVEAYRELEAALAYGAAPLEPQVHREAENYRVLLRGQLAEIEVSCTQPGIQPSLDGEPVLVCPGSRSTWVRPGPHTVVGMRDGFLPLERRVIAVAGRKHPVRVHLTALSEVTVMKRRWQPWMPWVVTGAGVAVAGAGVLLQVQAVHHNDDYGDRLEACGEAGCAPGAVPDSTRDLESRARLENKLAITAMIGGGVVAAAGVALAFINRPRAVLAEPGWRPRIMPVTPGGSLGLGVDIQF